MNLRACLCQEFTVEVVFIVKNECYRNTLRPRQNGRQFPEDILSACSWMKVYKFRLKFHWNLFPSAQATNHYLNQRWLVCWRIYVSLGLNKLTRPCVTLLQYGNRFDQRECITLLGCKCESVRLKKKCLISFQYFSSNDHMLVHVNIWLYYMCACLNLMVKSSFFLCQRYVCYVVMIWCNI